MMFFIMQNFLPEIILVFNLFLLLPRFFCKLFMINYFSSIALLNLLPLTRMIIGKIFDFDKALLFIN